MGDSSSEVLHVYSQELLVHAEFETTCNCEDIESSEICACYGCGRFFFSEEVKKYNNSGNAVCPFCGAVAVLSSATQVPLNPGFLAAMRDKWLRRTPRRR